MRNLSITSRMILVAFVPALLVTTLLSMYWIIYSVRDGEYTELQRVATLAKGLARASEFGVTTANAELLEDIAQPLLAVPSIFSVEFFDVQDTSLHLSGEREGADLSIGAVALQLRSWISQNPLINSISAPVLRTDLAQFDDPLFDGAASESLLGSRERNLGRVQLSIDLSLVYQEQIANIQQVMLYVIIVLLIGLAAAYHLAQSVISPIRTLTHSVRALARNDYIRVAVDPVGGELDELAHGVNFLSSELESFHAKQSEAISLATQDLQDTLSLLEQKNKELTAARETAEEASAFKSQFVANMSHEIRTPLNAIIGTLSVMSKSGLDITQVDQLDIINKSSTTLLYLIEDILDISKIESGNLVVESISTDLESLLNDVTMTASMQAVERGIELYVSPIPDLSLRGVYTDPMRLKQVLLNLLSNSIKFTDSGHVVLHTELVDVEPGLRTVNFVVEDTGIGIPEDKQETLFSAFTQVDMSTTRRYGGTGLGLFICQGIVELLDGTITLNSTENQGTRFDVVLPMRVANNAVVVEPLLTDSVSGLNYVDAYKPLQPKYKTLLGTVLQEIYEEHLSDTKKLSVHNIANRFLSSSWVGPMEPLIRDASDLHIALVSQISPVIKSRLQAAGYDGFVVKTPSLILLKRSVQQALSNQSFNNQPTFDLPDDRPEKRARQLTVLAIDDQRINIELLMQYFDHLEIRGIYASSGSEGLSHIENEHLDLVLLDLHMPVHDGFYVVEKIRNSGGANAQVPVIAMTADAYSNTRERAMASGFDSVLTKPATVQQVSAVIDQWTRQQTVSAESTTPMIDLKACAEAVRGNEEWVKGALRTYAKEIPDHIQAIDVSLREQNRDQLFEVAHAVKGVSRLFKINRVADCAEVLEASSSYAEWSVLKSQSNRLKQVLQSAAEECNSIDV